MVGAIFGARFGFNEIPVEFVNLLKNKNEKEGRDFIVSMVRNKNGK